MSELSKFAPERFLSVEDAAEKEKYKIEATALAFARHLYEVGRFENIKPNLAKGNMRISLVAFFNLPEFATRPLNRAALGILPDWSKYNSSTGDISYSGFYDVVNLLPEDATEAARRGCAYEHVVATRLGLFDPVTRTVLAKSRGIAHTHPLGALTDNMFMDLESLAVGDIRDVHALVQERGYRDFLDYLIDAQEIIADRVATMFELGLPEKV